MARPEVNTVTYFPHSVTHGKKMFYIREKYGNDGYAIWFLLLEELGKAEFHYLDLKDEVQVMYLSASFKASEEVIINIINDLVRMRDFDKQLWEEEKILFNQKFNDNVSDAYAKRINSVIDRPGLLLVLEGLGRIKPSNLRNYTPINPQSKEEYSKEETELNSAIEFPEEEKPIELPLPKEDVENKIRITNATKVIADYFGILEGQQGRQYMEIGNFVRTINKQGEGRLNWMADQFAAYRKVKDKNGYKHYWYNFTGTVANKYEDGEWNNVNWIKACEEMKPTPELIVYKRPQKKGT